eukprot:3379948-Alexandrium_andersonii.AAC.1
MARSPQQVYARRLSHIRWAPTNKVALPPPVSGFRGFFSIESRSPKLLGIPQGGLHICEP